MRYARVVVEVEPDHLDRPFDYALPAGLAAEVEAGSRVEVVFAGRRVRGLVVALDEETELLDGKVRDVRRVLGPHTWATPEEIEVFRWAAQRFAAPTAAVIRHALPPQRVRDVERRAEAAGWFPPGRAPRPPDPPRRAVDEAAWAAYGAAGSELRAAAESGAGAYFWRPLPHENLAARLVELVQGTLAGGRDVLLVVPESRSPEADAIARAFRDVTVDARGGPRARRLYRAWLEARCGRARVVIGERGVAFWHLSRLGLGVIVDEANPALKERRAPRHHAREVVLERARRAGAAAVLIGTVPSAAAWRLLAERRVRPVVPDRDPERAAAPIIRVDDRSVPGTPGRLGSTALESLRACVQRGELGVVLAARRGEGRALVCGRCGDRFACPVCDSSVAVASGGVSGLGAGSDLGLSRSATSPSKTAGGTGREAIVLCEGCGWSTEGQQLRCHRCGGDSFAPLAAGAERLGSELARTFRDTVVAVLEGYAQAAPPPPAIVVMTRGSALAEPPGPVGAVVLPDLDGQLRRPTLDAAEDALRLAFRVAAWLSRSCRAQRPTRGRGSLAPESAVVVQTREPGHHAVRALVQWDPGAFWREEARHRRELRFPPAAHAVRLDVQGDGRRVAVDLRSLLPRSDDVLGPRPLGGRSGLLIKSADRSATLAALAPLRVAWSQEGLDVRVDVDPIGVGF